MNDDKDGLLDRIKRGEFQLFNESSERFQNGVIHLSPIMVEALLIHHGYKRTSKCFLG